MAISVTRTAPPSVPTNVTATAVSGFWKCYSEESGSLVDRTTEFETVGTDVEMFAADDDYVYFSTENVKYNSDTDSRITQLHFVLSQFASASIEPTFEYNTGDNTWATLAVTDGTAGFTQDGTISATVVGFPNYNVWKIGSQDGSGNEIGDGVDRRYIRIKRTVNSLATNPKISEAGLGQLSASTTYYYSVKAIKADAISSGAYVNSVNASEVSATTTGVKRTIKVSWDVDAVAPLRMVWRTPVSGDYSSSGQQTGQSNKIDTYAQNVKGQYFNEYCGSTATQNYVLDDGLLLNFVGHATMEYYAYYMSCMYRPHARGLITVSGGTSGSEADWKDVLAADKAGSWNVFKRISMDSHLSYSGHDIYSCTDEILIDCNFKDNNFTLYTDSPIKASTNSYCTFGNRYNATYGGYDKMSSFIIYGGITDDFYVYFYNCTFYACNFITAPVDGSRNYTKFPHFKDNCNLYQCYISSLSLMEKCAFDGTNIIAKDILISNPRYGLDMSSTAVPTILVEDFTIQNASSGMYILNYPSGGEFTFRGIKMVNITTPIKQYSQTYPLTLHFVNLTIIGTSTMEDSQIGPNFVVYREWEFDLKIQDKDGTAIEGASVVLTDSQSNQTSLETDSNGEIETQDVIEKKHLPGTLVNSVYSEYNADSVTNYNPYIITISKAGYQTKTINLAITEKMELVETLEKQVPMIFVDGENPVLNLSPAKAVNPDGWLGLE